MPRVAVDLPAAVVRRATRRNTRSAIRLARLRWIWPSALILLLAAVWVIAAASTFVWGVALLLVLAALCVLG